MVDYVGRWKVRAELGSKQLLGWIGLPTSKYHLWRQYYGRPHAHNAHIPREGWLEAARAKRLGAKSCAAEQAITHTVLM